MQAQDNNHELTTLDMVAREQRRGIIRDRLVGAFLALGLIIGATTIESMAATGNKPANQAQWQSEKPVMLASALVVNIVQ